MTFGVIVYVAVPEDGTFNATLTQPVKELTHEPRSTGQIPCTYVGTPAGSVPGVVPVILLVTPGPLTTNWAPGSASMHESVACNQTVTVFPPEEAGDGVAVGVGTGFAVGVGVGGVVGFGAVAAGVFPAATLDPALLPVVWVAAVAVDVDAGDVVGVAPTIVLAVVSSVTVGVVVSFTVVDVVVSSTAVDVVVTGVVPAEVPSAPHAVTRTTILISAIVDTTALIQRQRPCFNKENIFIVD